MGQSASISLMGHLACVQTYCVFLWHQDICFQNQQRAYLYVSLVEDTTILLTSKQTDLSSFLGDVLNLSFGTNVMRKKISKKHSSLLLNKKLVSSVVWLLLSKYRTISLLKEASFPWYSANRKKREVMVQPTSNCGTCSTKSI